MKIKQKIKFEFYSIDEVYVSENWIYDLLELGTIPEDEMFQVFEGDPDLIKFGRYISEFITIDQGHPQNPTGKIIIVSNRELTYEEKSLLDAYFNNDFLEYNDGKEVQNWDSFHKSTNAVAYRGGSGYIYDIAIFDID